MADQLDSNEEDADQNTDEARSADGQSDGNPEVADGHAGGAVSMSEASEASEDLQEQLPSFEFRFETAKLLIELDDTTEAAVQVSNSLCCMLTPCSACAVVT